MLLICLAISVVYASAQNITLQLRSGQLLEGKYIGHTDSTINMVINGHTKPYAIPANNIQSGTLPGKTIIIDNNNIVITTKEEIHAAKVQRDMERRATKQKELQIASKNPNYMIGRALKNTGITALGSGVPCLAAGVATCIIGYSNITIDDNLAKARCATASCYLFGAGAALTIIGIPLYIEGQKIMDLNFNIKGNGAGIAFNF